jgi:hypothetical protein
MDIDYHKILKSNMINVLKDILIYYEINGFISGHHLYITFVTDDIKAILPDWLKLEHPKTMTIVIQYEYSNFKVNKNDFQISLSFKDILCDLKIPYKNIISFVDPYSKFGLTLIDKNETPIQEKERKSKKRGNLNLTKTKKVSKDNVIEFKKFKKD